MAIFINRFLTLAFGLYLICTALSGFDRLFSTPRKGHCEPMNIDLFMTAHGEAGLICDQPFKDNVVGIILDAQTHDVTLEFADGAAPFHLNIPVENTHHEKLLFAHRMHFGFLDNGLFAGAIELPLLYLNDPYGSEFGQSTPLAKPQKSLNAFEEFMKRCSFAQSLHRYNLGDEDSARSVLRGMDPYKMDYTPSLIRARQMAATPSVANVHGHSPQGMSLGGTGGRTATRPASTDDSTE
jgi:hypothetical protein